MECCRSWWRANRFFLDTWSWMTKRWYFIQEINSPLSHIQFNPHPLLNDNSEHGASSAFSSSLRLSFIIARTAFTFHGCSLSHHRRRQFLYYLTTRSLQLHQQFTVQSLSLSGARILIANFLCAERSKFYKIFICTCYVTPSSIECPNSKLDRKWYNMSLR